MLAGRRPPRQRNQGARGEDCGSTICSSPWNHANLSDGRAGAAVATPRGRPWPGPCFRGRRERLSRADRRRCTDPPFVQVHGITRSSAMGGPAPRSRRHGPGPGRGPASVGGESACRGPTGAVGQIHHLFKSMGSREPQRGRTGAAVATPRGRPAPSAPLHRSTICSSPWNHAKLSGGRAGVAVATPRARRWPGPCFRGRRQRLPRGRPAPLHRSTICSSPWNDGRRSPRAWGGGCRSHLPPTPASDPRRGGHNNPTPAGVALAPRRRR